MPVCPSQQHRHHTGNRHHAHHHTGVSSICAKRFDRHYGGQPALLNRHYRGTTIPQRLLDKCGHRCCPFHPPPDACPHVYRTEGGGFVQPSHCSSMCVEFCRLALPHFRRGNKTKDSRRHILCTIHACTLKYISRDSNPYEYSRGARSMPVQIVVATDNRNKAVSKS